MIFRSICFALGTLFACTAVPSYAQCSATPSCLPTPAVMVYRSETFYIPVIPLLSNGTGSRKKSDSDDLQRKYEGERGRGTVTDAVEEFKEMLELECAKKDRIWSEWLTLSDGDVCLFSFDRRFHARPLSSPGEFVEKYISSIHVFGQKYVAVIFDDTDPPCDETFTETLLLCLGEGRSNSPDPEGVYEF